MVLYLHDLTGLPFTVNMLAGQVNGSESVSVSTGNPFFDEHMHNEVTKMGANKAGETKRRRAKRRKKNDATQQAKKAAPAAG